MIKQESFFGSWNKENKQYWIDTMQEHQDADRLMQGDWFETCGDDFKGCFFGCAMQTEDATLRKATEAMGLPEWLIRLAEEIFEGLSREDALEFPVKLLQAIPVDTDLSIVRNKTSVLRLTPLAANNPVVSEVIKIHQKVIDGVEVSEEEWLAAESAAAVRSSEWSVEWSVEGSTARSAAWSAMRSAAYPVYPTEGLVSWSTAYTESRSYAVSDSISAGASVDWYVMSEEESVGASEAWERETSAWKKEADNLIKTLEELV